MILDDLQSASRYSSLLPGLEQGFEYLRSAFEQRPEVGRHAIDGDRVLAIVAENVGRGRAGAKLEAHRKYLDIQCLLAGSEEIGWRPASECREVSEPYSEERDILFYADQPRLWIPLAPRQFMIFFPADAHSPLAGEGPHVKVVIKVAV